MAIRQIRLGSLTNIHQYDDVDFDEAIETDQPIAAGSGTDPDHVLIRSDMPGIAAGGLTANKLVKTDASVDLDSVDNLADFVAGTANEITVINDGDGTITIEGAGSDTDFTVVVAIQAGGAGPIGFQYKTRALTLNGGIITTVGSESGWIDV